MTAEDYLPPEEALRRQKHMEGETGLKPSVIYANAPEELSSLITYPNFPPPLPEQSLEIQYSPKFRDGLWRLFWCQDADIQALEFESRPHMFYVLNSTSINTYDVIRDPHSGQPIDFSLNFTIFDEYPPFELHTSHMYNVDLAPKPKGNFHVYYFKVGPQTGGKDGGISISDWKQLQRYQPNSLTEPYVEQNPSEYQPDDEIYYDNDEYLDDVFHPEVPRHVKMTLNRLKTLRSMPRVLALEKGIEEKMTEINIPNVEDYKNMFEIEDGSVEGQFLEELHAVYTDAVSGPTPVTPMNLKALNRQLLQFITNLKDVPNKIKYLVHKYDCSEEEASDIYWEKQWNKAFGAVDQNNN